MATTYRIYPEGGSWSESYTRNTRWQCEWIAFCMGNRELWRFVTTLGRPMPRRICVETL